MTESLKELLGGLYLSQFTILEIKTEENLKHKNALAQTPSSIRGMMLTYVTWPVENSTAHGNEKGK